MKRSNILRDDHRDMILLYKRMKPEERLAAYVHHAELIHQIYQAGMSYRSASLLPAGKKRAKHA